MTTRVTKHPCSADSVWNGRLMEVLAHGAQVPSRDGLSLEIIGAGMRLHPDMSFVSVPERNLSPSYAMAELLWYLSGTDRTEMLEAYAPQYSRFAEPDGTVHGAYGPRVMPHMKTVLEELAARPYTRRCVVPVYLPDDLGLAGGKRDLPCTLGWQFMVRDKRLEMVGFMRSNDLWLGWPYDVFVNCCIQYLVASQLGLEPGFYTHLVSSLHLYQRDVEKARACLNSNTVETDDEGHGWSCGSYDIFTDIEKAVELETRTRGLTWDDRVELLIGQAVFSLKSEVLADAVLCCASKWCGDPFIREAIVSPVMRKAVLRADSRRG